MSNRQDVYNENDNHSDKIISIKYNITSHGSTPWNHREIEYNNAGIPILRLYDGETKQIKKSIFLNGKEIDAKLYIREPYIVRSNGDLLVRTVNYNNYTTIGVTGVGTYLLSNDTTGVLTDYDNTNNTELLIIVEPEPTIVGLEWNEENPLAITNNSSHTLKMNYICENGQKFPLSEETISKLNIKSSNVLFAICQGSEVVYKMEYGMCKLYIPDSNLKQVFGENIKNIEPLKIITAEKDSSIYNHFIKHGSRSTISSNDSITTNIDSNVDLKIILDQWDEDSLIRPITPRDIIMYYNLKITSGNQNIELKNKKTIYSKQLGYSTIKATVQNAEYTNSEISEIPTEIIFRINIHNSIKSVDWSINTPSITVDGNSAYITVKVQYDDGSIEDVSKTCSFDYDNRYITITENKITAKAPGNVRIKLTTAFATGSGEYIRSDKIITLEVIQPITMMNLNKRLLDLKVGDKERLEFIYEPKNATPKDLEWTSSDPNIISVDNIGNVIALDRGSADIIVSTKNTADDNSKNIYLPTADDYGMTVFTNSEGIGKISLNNVNTVIYTVKVYDSNNKPLEKVGVSWWNTITEQYLALYNFPENTLLDYNHNIYVEVTNCYDEKVYGMNVSIDENEFNFSKEIKTITNKDGIATLQALNTTYTNESGLAIIDGIRVTIKYVNDYLSNIEVNHTENNVLIINTKEELDSMRKLFITLTNNEDEDIRSALTKIKVKVYNKNVLIYNDYPDKTGNIILNDNNAIDEVDENETDDINKDNIVSNLVIYDPSKCAICKVISTAISITGIKFRQDNYTMDVDDKSLELNVVVTPENATFKDYSIYIDDENVARLDNDECLYGYKAGTTKIYVISKDNPDIKGEATVTITNHRLQKIIIGDGNDDDYEWYDHLNEQRMYDANGEYTSIGSRVTNEKYDDDDIKRYYLPINNSLKLPVSFIPQDASNTKIKWLSSDSSLVKVNNKGIITAIRYGKQDLDVYGDDNISENRFANTVWITAINTRYNKYDVCQVRVVRNKALSIDIPEPAEHDYDEDDILADGSYDTNSEHEFDYVMQVGDTIEIPVLLSTQYDEFGTSDFLKWYGSSNINDVLSITKGSPNHSNAHDDDFDWTITTPTKVNSAKNKFNVKVKALAIGDTYFYAKTYDNVRRAGEKQLYVPDETIVSEIPNSGMTKLSDGNNTYYIRLDWFSKSNTIAKDYKKLVKQYITRQILQLGPKSGTISFGGVKVFDNGEFKVDEVIDENYALEYGFPIVGAKCMLSPNGIIKIEIPDSCHVRNLKMSMNSEALPLTFDFVPATDKTIKTTIDSLGNEVLDTSKADSYIQVTIYGYENNTQKVPILLNGFYTEIGVGNIRKNYALIATPTNTLNKSEYTITSYFPASDKWGETIIADYGDPFNARPGMGTWINGPKSRKVKVRVVATPSKLNIGWVNAYNDKLESINTIKSNSIVRNKWSKNTYRYMAIGFDDDFNELLEDAKNRHEELAEKYKSFAWFSDNEDVIRFEDVENLEYKDKNGKYTNNPNENYQETRLSPQTISLKHIDSSKYDGYRNVNSMVDIKFGDNYSAYSNKDDIYINNTNLCTMRFTAPRDGQIYINHTGTLKYTDNEQFTNAKTLSVSNGYQDSKISVHRGDILYVRGNTSTIVYIKSFGLYPTSGMGEVHTSAAFIKNKVPTEYVAYNENIFLNIPNDDKYTSNEGVYLYSGANVKFKSEYTAEVKITFKSGSIKIKHGSSTQTVGASVSPYILKTVANTEYIISGTSDSSPAIISNIEYTNILNGKTTGSLKGTSAYTVKPSYMKRVICEGKGTAGIYVLSPKGKALIKLNITIK